MTKPLDFYASLTDSPSVVRKIRALVAEADLQINPLEQVLISPVFASANSLQQMQVLSDEGSSVLFDSGGYYVQIGRLEYEELYMPLLEAYKQNTWASVYTLPDHVPTSQDSAEEVAHKVKDTITFSTIFFHELPDTLKEKAMPVVQGHTIQQIEDCLRAYITLGVNRIGFGSFGTSGKSSEVNMATQSSIDLVRHVITVAHEHNIKVHLFGLGRPALVAMIKGIGADTFDSASWLKSAGFGNIFLPFMRGYNITYRNTIGQMDLGITFKQFRKLAEMTGHQCKYCRSLDLLQQNKLYRAVHNLIVMTESVQAANQQEHERISHIYQNGSPKYREEYEKWLQPGS